MQTQLTPVQHSFELHQLTHFSSEYCSNRWSADGWMEKKRKWKYWSLSRVWLCSPLNLSLPGSSLSGISQEWVAIPFSKGSSQPRDRTWVSRIADIFFTIWASGEAHEYRGLIVRLYVDFQLQWVSAPLTTAPPHLFKDQLYKSGETVVGYFIKHNQLLLAFKKCSYPHRFLLKME